VTADAYPAPRLLAMAIAWLREKHPDALIIPEFSAANFGGAKIDVVAVTATQLVGVEIKGDGDSPTRLAIQGPAYSAVCTSMFLLPAPSLFLRCANKRPPGWSMLIAEGDSIRMGDRSGQYLPTSPYRLMEMMWAAEVRELARLLQADVMGCRGCDAIGRRIAETVPLESIRKRVLETLLLRNWRQFNKTVYRPDAA